MGLGRLQVGGLAGGDDEAGAGVAQRLGDLQAEASGPPGDQRGLAAEVEELGGRHANLSCGGVERWRGSGGQKASAASAMRPSAPDCARRTNASTAGMAAP